MAKKFSYSGSCFVLSKNDIDNILVTSVLKKDSQELSDWNLQETENYIIGASFMPQHDIVSYFKSIGINENFIQYED